VDPVERRQGAVVDPQIFITYSSKDQKVARTICTALENRGLVCWISARNVKPGQNYQEQIVRAIRTAKIMVLVFTANANNSNEIKKELALASQNNLLVIPVRIDDVVPNEAFAYEFATRQWIDLFEDWENSIAQLVELIAASIDDHPSGNRAKAGLESAENAPAPSIDKPVTIAPATAPASFLRRSSSPAAVIAIAAVIIAAVVAYEAGTFLHRGSSSPVTMTAGSQPQAAIQPGQPQQTQLVPPSASPSSAPSQPVVQPQQTPTPPPPSPSSAPSQQAALPVAPDISGKYTAHGTNPDGSMYSGSVTIRRDGNRYRFDWVIANGQALHGTGILNGHTISVDWGQTYPVIYLVGPNGVLTGTWNNGTATETLIPD
jgi:hypothetical protein